MKTDWQPLSRDFYEAKTEEVAQNLLGHFLLASTRSGDGRESFCGGLIVETEAYLTDDPACHAYRRQTARNASMWGAPGHAYVYLIYGYHFCFNAVCGKVGVAEAILVRALEPTFGIETLRKNRAAKTERDLTNGPAKFCAAMNITRALDGVDLCDAASSLFIARNPDAESARRELGPQITTTRIGLTKAADWPLRYYLRGSDFVSRRAPGDKKSRASTRAAIVPPAEK